MFSSFVYLMHVAEIARTHPPAPPLPTHTQSHISGKEELKQDDRGRMTDRKRELVPDNWSLVRESALTTGLYSEGWYSEHSGVCRRAELPGKEWKGEEVLKGRWEPV